MTHLYAVVDSDAAQSKIGSALLASGWDARGRSGRSAGASSASAWPTSPTRRSSTRPPAPPGMELLSVSTSRCERA